MRSALINRRRHRNTPSDDELVVIVVVSFALVFLCGMGIGYLLGAV